MIYTVITKEKSLILIFSVCYISFPYCVVSCLFKVGQSVPSRINLMRCNTNKTPSKSRPSWHTWLSRNIDMVSPKIAIFEQHITLPYHFFPDLIYEWVSEMCNYLLKMPQGLENNSRFRLKQTIRTHNKATVYFNPCIMTK